MLDRQAQQLAPSRCGQKSLRRSSEYDINNVINTVTFVPSTPEARPSLGHRLLAIAHSSSVVRRPKQIGSRGASH
jgi:hypothetical protein